MKLLTTKETALLLRVTPDTLKHWRMQGIGPDWVKLSDRQNSPVLYSAADVAAWIEQRKGRRG